MEKKIITKKNLISHLAKSHQSIFEKSSRGSHVKLKDNMRFHLYISKGPCGDATTYGIGGAPKSHPDR